MKSLTLPLLLLCSAIGPSSTLTDKKGLTMSFKLLHALTGNKDISDISMIGDVVVISIPQGLRMTSDSMILHAIPDRKDAKSYVIQHAIAAGHVVISKEVTAQGSKKVTRIEGSKADYAAAATESFVNMAGPVKMQSLDSSHHQTMVATGHSGTAVLEPLNKTSLDNGLKKASMDGSVHLVLNQLDPSTQKTSTIVTDSDHMILENQSTGQRVTLTGSVRLTDQSGFVLSGVNHAVFFLDKKGNYNLETVTK